ncbi:uncharacterized protein LOC125853435 [Solanum stenotomum]|uniref:uncharacterized protein LOC125853435 n=1 Tax=Solanum stenotomum TaxID=172797 RepID=UPI0020D0A85B|nr:uncharacterized protein LOC125853435 [Solanum stenotomum]
MDHSWIYNMTNFGRMGLRPEFVEGVTGFVEHVKTLEPFQHNGVIKCPCNKCQCLNYPKSDIVELLLFRNGFKKEYTVWTSHGEIDNSFDVFQHYVPGESSSVVNSNAENYRMHDMVQDVFGVHSDFESGNQGEEAPNAECKIFFEQLEVDSRPFYEGSPHLQLDPRFKQMSEIGQKARSSTKGGCLHTSGVQSQGSVRKKLEKELGRPLTQAKAFKVTHIRKKKNPKDPDVWVEPRAEMTYNRYLQALEDLRQTQLEENRGILLTQKQAERVWLDLIGGPSRYGYAYGMLKQNFREYHSEFEHQSSSYDDESMKKNLAMEQKIAEQSRQVEDSQAREKRRDLEYEYLKAQFDALLASGGIPPCSNDVTFPPRPSQSQPTRYPVYSQQRNMIDESSSDEEDEDHMANTLPH